MAGDLDFSSVSLEEHCRDCGETIPHQASQQPRMQKLARWMLFACVPLNLVWFAGVGVLLSLGIGPRDPPSLVGFVLFSFLPTIVLARTAWRMARVITVRCRKCGWSEDRLGSVRR